SQLYEEWCKSRRNRGSVRAFVTVSSTLGGRATAPRRYASQTSWIALACAPKAFNSSACASRSERRSVANADTEEENAGRPFPLPLPSSSRDGRIEAWCVMLE